MAELTHMDSNGNALMVDVGGKDSTQREAIAKGSIQISEEAFRTIVERRVAKGDVLTVAQIAGITGAKRTSELIPLCHPLFLTGVKVNFELDEQSLSVHCTASVKTSGKTGVEMEALTAVSSALLTVYDMIKAIDKSPVLSNIRLVRKTGGKSGTWVRGN